MEKNLQHPPVELYCLNCGVLINKSFTGGLWSYTHPCNLARNPKEILDFKDKNSNDCTVFVTRKDKNWNLVIGTRFHTNLSHDKCKSCKDETEHILKTKQEFLGERFEQYTPEDAEIAKQKASFIKIIKERVKTDNEMPQENFIDYDELMKETMKRWKDKK